MGFSPASSVPSAGGGGGVATQGARDATAQAWLVDGSAVTQPVTGPLTDAELRAAVVPVGDGGGSLTVDGAVGLTGAVALDAATLAALETIQVGNLPAVQPVSDNGGSLTVDGPLTDTELRAAPVPVDASGATVPVSVAALPLPDGAATEATLAAMAATLAASATTLEQAASALDDIALTAIIQRDAVAA